jgi:geranylgeranyl pyrophosphate synthase
VVVAARRAGIAGMVGGQVADLEAELRTIGPDELRWIHRRKTGALFSASTEIGAIHAGIDGDARAALAEYGEAFGLAFQIVDDILDRTGSSEILGKTPGKDLRSGKSTFPAHFGLDESRRQAEAQAQGAIDCLRPLSLRSERLEALARFAVTRVH